MTPMMQTLVVLLIVTGALTYVGRRVWQTMAKSRRAKAAAAGGACGDGCCK